MRIASPAATLVNVDWLYEIRKGRAYGSAWSQSAVVGQNSIIQLFNPVGSGKIAIVRAVFVASTTAQEVALCFYNTALGGGTLNVIGLDNGAPNGVSLLYRGSNAGFLGTQFASIVVSVSQSIPYMGEWVCKLDAGEGLAVEGGTVNTLIFAAFQHIEF